MASFTRFFFLVGGCMSIGFGCARPRASGPAAPVVPVKTGCVLHAGESFRTTIAPTLRASTGDAQPRPETETSWCYFNAECGQPGRHVANDGFVDVECRDHTCTCSVSDKMREGEEVKWTLQRSNAGAADECQTVLVHQCMKGMPPPIQ